MSTRLKSFIYCCTWQIFSIISQYFSTKPSTSKTVQCYIFFIEIRFTDQNNQPFKGEDKVNLKLIFD